MATQNNNLQPIKHDVPDRLMDHAEARKQSLEEWKLFQNTVVDPVMEGLGEELGLDYVQMLRLYCEKRRETDKRYSDCETQLEAS